MLERGVNSGDAAEYTCCVAVDNKERSISCLPTPAIPMHTGTHLPIKSVDVTGMAGRRRKDDTPPHKNFY